MKEIIKVVIFLFLTDVYSQTNVSSVSPTHVGAISNSNISYVIGKIYVLPPLLFEKQKKEENIILNNIIISPNPVTNILKIDVLDKSEIKTISVSDMSGRLVFSYTLEKNYSVDLSFLKQGTYIIKLDNDNSKTFKIIKN